MVATRVTLHIQGEDPGRIPTDALRDALDHLTGMLHDIEDQLQERDHESTSWFVTGLHFGSATIDLEPSDSVVAAPVITALLDGLALVSSEAVRPPYFSDMVLEHARSLSRLVGDGVAGIQLFSNGFASREVVVTEHIAANVRAILEHHESFGSVEGVLEVLSSRGGLHFSITDVVTGSRVRCDFPAEMLEKAAVAFRRRILVVGRIRSDNMGTPKRVWVRHMEMRPLAKDLPQPEDVRGLIPDLTGGLPSEVYIEERWGGG